MIGSMKKKYIVSIILSTLFFSWSVIAQSIEQRVDEMFVWIEHQITQRVAGISMIRIRANHENRLWNRHALLLNRYIRLWNNTDKILYQAVQTKIVERKNDYLTQSTSDLIKQQELINAINSYRSTKNLVPFNYNSKLTQAAYRHALDLSNNFPYDADWDWVKELIWHIGSDGTRVMNRVQDTWYIYLFLAENIAYNQITANQVLYDWINSPLHHANLLTDKARDIGIVKIWSYWVMVIGRD